MSFFVFREGKEFPYFWFILMQQSSHVHFKLSLTKQKTLGPVVIFCPRWEKNNKTCSRHFNCNEHCDSVWGVCNKPGVHFWCLILVIASQQPRKRNKFAINSQFIFSSWHNISFFFWYCLSASQAQKQNATFCSCLLISGKEVHADKMIAFLAPTV